MRIRETPLTAFCGHDVADAPRAIRSFILEAT